MAKLSMREMFSSLHNKNFRILFIGQALSTIGTLMQSIALVWLVLTLTHSGTALGIVMALQYLPILFLSLVGGMIADRYPNRTILFITQSLFTLFALVLGVLVLTGTVKLWMVYVVSFLFGLVTAVDNPTAKTFIMEIVGKDELRNATSLNNISFNLARLLGSAIGGVLIAAIGLASCFFINALSYVAVLVSLCLLRGLGKHVPKPRSKISEGLHYVRSHPVIFPVLVMIFIIGTLSYEFGVSLPILAEFTFHGDARTIAELLVALSLGAIVGGLWSANSKNHTFDQLVMLSFVFGALMVVTSVMPSFPLVLLMLFFTGAVSIDLVSSTSTLLQLESRPDMIGRVNAFWTMAFLGSTTVGAPIIGWVGDHVGPRWGLAVGGVAAIVAAIVGALMLRHKTAHASA